MKKIFFLIFFIIFTILAFSSSPTKIHAQTESISPAPEIQSNQATPSTYVKYDLAYPGMLPDNRLYKLKILRDKISEALIKDPKKKIDFYLLQTDKGILSAAILVDKNEIALASETALKAEHNYTLLTQELYRLDTKQNKAFFDRLKQASLKHQEVLVSLIKRLPKDKQKTFAEVLSFSKRNLESVKEYQNQL